MKPALKYAVCIFAGAIIEFIGVLLVVGATFTGEHTAPVPAGFSFVFPYAFVLSPHGDANGFRGWFLIIITFLQMPVYGWIWHADGYGNDFYVHSYGLG